MRRSQILSDSSSFTLEFARCCRTYNRLRVAVAWCGNPAVTIPYDYLSGFDGEIRATIGVKFNDTHPDVFGWFKGIGAEVRVFDDRAGLFHPKVYLFRKGTRFALFTGSSNLTYGGVYSNVEVNSLIEGSFSGGLEIGTSLNLEDSLATWHSPPISFKPTKEWLRDYRQRYLRSLAKQRGQGLLTPQRFEDDTPISSWLRNGDWEVYLKKVREGLRRNLGFEQGYHDVLEASAKRLPLPWKPDYLDDETKRSVILGAGKGGEYALLGHVGASGKFAGLLAGARPRERSVMCRSINAAARFEVPVPWNQLRDQLSRLVELGPTMKVWGRLLCLVRPDLYCTVASPIVRRELSGTIGIPQSHLARPDGYVQLVRLVHSSPWFNSKRPKPTSDSAIWKRRAAFLDAIFLQLGVSLLSLAPTEALMTGRCGGLGRALLLFLLAFAVRAALPHFALLDPLLARGM